MTVASTTVKSGPYNGNGSTTDFAVNSKYTAKSEVTVIVTSAAGVETAKTLDTHYTLTNPGDTGTVSFITSPTDHRPQSGETVTILTALPLTQATDLTSGGGLSSNVLEGAYDKLTRLVQQIAEKVTRAPKLRQTTATGEITLPEPAAGKLLAWNDDADDLENVAAADIDLAAVTPFIETLLDDADAATARGTLGAIGGSTGITDNAILRGDGTGGATAQNSVVTITDAGIMNGAVAVGVNATADTTNRLSVNSAAVLFNNEGANVQLKANKNASGDTASYLFQTGFSGRAEFGLIGDNDFTLKTSPDGSVFTTALIASNADGALRVGVRISPSVDNGAALGSATVSWADLFLASGGVVNWANSNYTITHSSGDLAFSGTVTLTNAGLHLLDTNASHDLIIAPGSDLSADRTLTVTTGDTNITLDLTDPGADRVMIWDDSGAKWGPATLAGGLEISGTTLRALESFVIAASDETTNITAGANKVKFRMPYAFTVTAVRASLSTAQASGSIFTVDIHESGSTILSTKLTIDNTETTSTTAATPAAISDASLADDAEISIDVDQVGTAGAKGLKVTLIGYRP